MGEAKKWYTVTCNLHGVTPKGQNYKEVIVPAPAKGEKMRSRARVECPFCKAARLKALQEA